MISTLFGTLISTLASHRDLALENLALRQQIVVLQRSVKRPRLKKSDRVFWVLLAKIWNDWANTLTLVKPDTVVRWHRKGFRLYWTWKSRRKGQGRPAVPSEVRQLIRRMSQANSRWGAPRVHGESAQARHRDLTGGGLQVHGASSQASVAEAGGRSSTTTLGDLVSVDFFTVSTVTFRVLFVFVVLAHERRRVVHFNVT